MSNDRRWLLPSCRASKRWLLLCCCLNVVGCYRDHRGDGPPARDNVKAEIEEMERACAPIKGDPRQRALNAQVKQVDQLLLDGKRSDAAQLARRLVLDCQQAVASRKPAAPRAQPAAAPKDKPPRAARRRRVRRGPRGAVWFYRRRGKVKGPHTVAQVRRLARKRRIDATVELWRRGLTAWTRLSVIPEFTTLVRWYYRLSHKSRRRGPLTAIALRRQLRAGKVPKTALGWYKGARRWRPLASLPEFAPPPPRPTHVARPSKPAAPQATGEGGPAPTSKPAVPPVLVKARKACAPLQNDLRFRHRPATKIKSRLQAIAAALGRGATDEAEKLATALARACKNEARWRDEVAPMLGMVQQVRHRVAPRYYARFLAMLEAGNYANAIACGEGIVRGVPDQCMAAIERTGDLLPPPDSDGGGGGATGDGDGGDGDATTAPPSVAGGAAPAKRDSATGVGYPFSLIVTPVESGALRSHVDLQFQYTRGYSFGNLDDLSLSPEHQSVVMFALQAQYAYADRIEVGLTVPFFQYGTGAGVPLIFDESMFGNLEVGVKVKLFGRSSGPFVLSAFADSTLPTVSIDLESRGFALLRAGLAVSSHLPLLLGGLTVGGAVSSISFLTEGDDLVGMGIDAFGVLRLHRLIAVQLSLQLGIPIDPRGGRPSVALNPAVQFFPIPSLHVDLGARIALTDYPCPDCPDNVDLPADDYATAGGRAAFIFATGWLF